MVKITAVIITQNEARNIGRCLQSLQDIADEVVVVDSGSTDATEQICASFNVRFTPHPWEGYDGQKNFADTLASHDWILSIDADEALSPALQTSLRDFKNGSPADNEVFSVCRLNNYCGSWIHHCGWYPDEKVRLWRKGVASWDGVVHEEIRYDRPVIKKRLAGDLLHYTYYSVADHASRQVKYATLAAQKAHQQGRKCRRCTLALKPLWTFLRNYIFKGGFLDGRAGFLVCKMSAFYTLVKYAKLNELSNKPLNSQN